jgi:gluconate 5-dehydrogenase
MNYFDLTGKVAVVTGASSGLGADAARAYAQSGAKVALLARRKDKLAGVADEIRKAGGQAVTVECDVSKEESCKAAVTEVIREYGRIDILLNNAGVAQRGSVETLTVDEWDNSMNVNVRGIFLMAKYVIPQMKKQNYGKVVNIASINALLADKDDMFVRHVYNASKNAVIGLTKGMAASYGRYNITVNAIGPGLFESEMTENTLFKSKEFLDAYNAITPADRPAKRGELNGTVLYFSTDASSYVTGQFIFVDGGFDIV